MELYIAQEIKNSDLGDPGLNLFDIIYIVYDAKLNSVLDKELM